MKDEFYEFIGPRKDILEATSTLVSDVGDILQHLRHSHLNSVTNKISNERLDTRSAKDKTQMLIDGFEKFQKNFELSEEEIETLKITFIKEFF